MKFLIRDIIWLILVVALAMGWWKSHQRMQRECNVRIATAIAKAIQEKEASDKEAQSWKDEAIRANRVLHSVGLTSDRKIVESIYSSRPPRKKRMDEYND